MLLGGRYRQDGNGLRHAAMGVGLGKVACRPVGPET
jgi:hypothetical protein